MQLLDKAIDVDFIEEDLPYEEEILRNAYSVKHWMRYAEHKKNAPSPVINMLYERALKELPGSYKLWYNYLKARRKQMKGKCVTDAAFDETNQFFQSITNLYELNAIYKHNQHCFR